jgi:hypothetical protein
MYTEFVNTVPLHRDVFANMILEGALPHFLLGCRAVFEKKPSFLSSLSIFELTKL